MPVKVLPFLKRKSLDQRGDTIVEVLISIAVVSLVLGGAYVTTNKSLMAERASEEQSSAVKLTESQLELIKGLVATDAGTATLNSAPQAFCVSSATTVAASTSAACKLDSTGAATTVEPVYNVKIEKQSNDVFSITTEWNSIKQDGKDKVQMFYRIYP